MRTYLDLLSEMHHLISVRDYVSASLTNMRIDKTTAHSLNKNLKDYDNKIMKIISSDDFKAYLSIDDFNGGSPLVSEKEKEDKITLQKNIHNGHVQYLKDLASSIDQADVFKSDLFKSDLFTVPDLPVETKSTPVETVVEEPVVQEQVVTETPTVETPVEAPTPPKRNYKKVKRVKD